MNLLRPLTPFALVLLSSTSGCGLLAAATNPGAFWAVNDPANLQIVVRRADAALITTAEVNRLLTATPAGADTPWVASVSPDPKEAAAEIKALQNDPAYAVTKARVVAAEVWMRSLGSVGATSGQHPSLLAAIDQGLADSYLAIGLKQAEIASLQAQIDAEKQAASADGASAADKKAHGDQVTELQKRTDEAQAAVEPLRRKFAGQVKDACAKLPNDDKARYAAAVASMLAALDDADMANSAAALKYPLVLKGLPEALKKVVPEIAMDIVEEQTGVRPNLSNLNVNVSISGGSPTITLDGLGDVGALQPAEVIKLTVTRSVAWFTHTLTLLATIASTKDKISFERDTLLQMQAAFAPAAPTLVVVKVPAFDSPEVVKATPARLDSVVAMKRAKSTGASAPTGAVAARLSAVSGALPHAPAIPAGGAALPGAPAIPGGRSLRGAAGLPGAAVVVEGAKPTEAATKKDEKKLVPPKPEKKK